MSESSDKFASDRSLSAIPEYVVASRGWSEDPTPEQVNARVQITRGLRHKARHLEVEGKLDGYRNQVRLKMTENSVDDINTAMLAMMGSANCFRRAGRPREALKILRLSLEIALRWRTALQRGKETTEDLSLLTCAKKLRSAGLLEKDDYCTFVRVIQATPKKEKAIERHLDDLIPVVRRLFDFFPSQEQAEEIRDISVPRCGSARLIS